MSSILMFDDVNASILPPGYDAYACYVDGLYRNDAAVKAKFPHANILTIAVKASDDADCLDVETGDATIADIYSWLTRQMKRGVWRPAVYTSVAHVDRMMLTMYANRFARSQYRIWSAHYGEGEHVCGPATCRQTHTACDATQFTSTALGKSLDESVCNPDFLKAPTPVAPAPKPGSGVQSGWRWCSKCEGMFYGPNQAKSRCPGGGQHDGNGSYDYHLNWTTP